MTRTNGMALCCLFGAWLTCYLDLVLECTNDSYADESVDSEYHSNLTESVMQETRRLAQEFVREQIASVNQDQDDVAIATLIAENAASQMPCRILMRRDILSRGFNEIPDYAESVRANSDIGSLTLIEGSQVQVFAIGSVDSNTALALSELDAQPCFFELEDDPDAAINWLFQQSDALLRPEAMVIIRFPCVTSDNVGCTLVCIESWSMRVDMTSNALQWYRVSEKVEVLLSID